MDAVDAPGLTSLVHMYLWVGAGTVAFLAVFAVCSHLVTRLETWWHMRRVRRDVARREAQRNTAMRWRRVWR